MSTQYHFMGGIPKKDILSRTDIQIIKNPVPAGEDKEYLQDKYGNILHINPQMIGNSGENIYLDTENIREVERYGSNNPTYIIDTLIKEYNIVFYSDNGFDYWCRLDNELLSKDKDLYESTIWKIIKEDMEREGYIVNDEKVTIPTRKEEDYIKN